MTLNSKQNRKKYRTQKDKKLVSLKELVENADLYKSV